MILTDTLKELSGLVYAADQKAFLAIQDELGRIYKLDRRTFRIKEVIDFATQGDFEDLTVVKDTIYAVKSSGVLYRIVRHKKSYRTEKLKPGLSKEYDVEGLAFDQSSKALLIACKSLPVGMAADEKHIYTFYPGQASIDTSRPIRMVKSEWLSFLDHQSDTTAAAKLKALLQSPDKNGGFRFSPSAIAVHPHSGLYYLLSAVGNMLAVITPRGTPLGLYRLDKDWFEQPESICFDADGALYIGSEGKKGAAVIVKYRMIAKNK
jgi:uncharacterized protein YjiK